MGPMLRDFAPQILALLVAGLTASLGLAYAARRARARAALEKASGWLFGMACTAMSAAAGLAAYAQLLAILDAPGFSPEELAPARLFALGITIGVPLSLPAVVFAWSDARAARRARLKRRDFVPTKDDRRKFADDLVEQILDVSPRPRQVNASVGGEGGRVLRLEGDVDAGEGERLTAALRADLAELGFKRVEGTGGAKEWWSRV